jgi:methionine-rich copper-binding protein CopC
MKMNQTDRAGRRLAAILVALAFALSFFSVSAPAYAFDLVSADPAVNSTIATAPSAVTLTFSSEITETGSSLSVRAPSGLGVDDGSLLIDGPTALIGLKKLDEGGRYTVTYQFMSIDGELLTGNYSFTYDAPAEIAAPSATPSPSSAVSEEAVSPAEATGKSSRVTDIFMIALLVISFLVLVFVARSLRNPKSKRRKKK